MAHPVTMMDVKLIVEMNNLNADVAERLEAAVKGLWKAEDEVIYLKALVERLRADNVDLLARLDAAAFAVQHGLREVAEKQREADERVMSSIYGAEAVTYLRAAPLVTDND